jgi:thiamine-phosphate pyrophosphorylase
MQLPRLFVIADAQMARDGGHELTWVIREVLEAGARFLLFREKQLPPNERLVLAHEIAGIANQFNATMIVASDHAIATRVGANGVHLANEDRIERNTASILGRSCHDGDEIPTTVDYITYSPIFPTQSKPEYGPALGPEAITSVTTRPGTPPLYALGGITDKRIDTCLQAGAYGVAVMGEIMRAKDPRNVTSQLLHLLA